MGGGGGGWGGGGGGWGCGGSGGEFKETVVDRGKKRLLTGAPWAWKQQYAEEHPVVETGSDNVDGNKDCCTPSSGAGLGLFSVKSPCPSA